MERANGRKRFLLEALGRGPCIPVVTACLKAVLHSHDVRLHLPSVVDERGVGVTFCHQQLELGDPALTDHTPGVRAHVSGDGVHLALLEVGGEVLAVDWGAGPKKKTLISQAATLASPWQVCCETPPPSAGSTEDRRQLQPSSGAQRNARMGKRGGVK